METFIRQVQCNYCNSVTQIDTRGIIEFTCPNCGNKIQLNFEQTSNGNQVNRQYYNQPTVNTGKLDQVALGLAGFSLICCGGIWLAIPAIILAIIVLCDKSGKYVRKHNAKAAIVLGIISAVFSIIAMIVQLRSNDNTYITYQDDINNTSSSYSSNNIEDALILDPDISISESIETSDNTSKEVDYSKIKYNTYTYRELLQELDNNALKAEETHQDEYVEVTGRINVIDSDGKYISINGGEDDYEFGFITLHIQLTTDEQKNQLMKLKVNDKITVKGQITSIGEILGYSIDAHSIVLDDKVDIDSIKYEEYNYTKIFDDIKENMILAQDIYLDKYIAVTGYVSEIKGDYISIGCKSDEYNEYTFDNIQCYFDIEKHKEQLVKLKTDSKVKMYGKVIKVDGEYRALVKIDLYKMEIL